MSGEGDFAASMARLEELLARAEQCCSPESLPVVRELVRALLEVHRVGIAELLRALDEGSPAPGDVIQAAAERRAVAGLLLMHDLHPDALATRVARALRDANAAGTGAAVAELVGIDGADVRVRISGKPAAARLLANVAERALCERAPDGAVHLDVQAEGEDFPRGLVPLERLRARSGGAQ
jgi:hypothetical protein